MNMSSTKRDLMTWIRETDEEYSKPLFARSLPYLVELAFSLPANWFGLTPSLLIGPMWTGLVLGPQVAPTFNVKLLVFAILFTIPLLAAWASLLRGHSGPYKKVFMGQESLSLCPLISVATCYCLIDNPELFSMAVYPLFLWMPSLVCVLLAKRTFLRQRPCTNPSYSKFIENKHFQIITKTMAQHSGNESFPSGDAAGAMAFAVTAVLAGRTNLGVTIALLACTGRVYYLAHHVLDTIAGCLTTLAVHLVLSEGFGFSFTGLTVVHPLAMQVGFLGAIYAYSCARKRHASQSEQR